MTPDHAEHLLGTAAGLLALTTATTGRLSLYGQPLLHTAILLPLAALAAIWLAWIRLVIPR